MTTLLDTLSLSEFVWLRPWWLLSLLPLPLLLWRLFRRQPGAGRWQDIIDAHLLRVLLQQSGNRKRSRTPLVLIGLAWLVAAIALAGPSIRSQDTPLFQRDSARVYVLDLSPSMNADDVKPSRLARARLKLLDALATRRDGEQALLVYAGSAHVLTPLATDARTLAAQVPELNTALLPVSGNRPELALQRAVQLLQDAGHESGEILWLTDGIDADQTDRVIAALQDHNVQLGILAIGTSEGAPVRQSNGKLLTDRGGNVVLASLNLAPLQKVVAATHGKLVTLQADDSDWQALEFTAPVMSGVSRRIDGSQALREDAGAWLVLPLIVLALLAFRRGSLLPVFVLALTSLSPRTDASEGPGNWWQDLWRTRDQQAAQQLAKGELKTASQLFENPNWRATAQYRAGDFDAAAQSFAGDDANSQFNRANALAKAGKLAQAIAGYDAALKQQANFTAAKENRDAVEKLRRQQDQQKQNSASQDSKESDKQKQQDTQNQSGSDDKKNQQPQAGDKSAETQKSGESQSATDPTGESGQNEKQQGKEKEPPKADQAADSKNAQQVKKEKAEAKKEAGKQKSADGDKAGDDDEQTLPANQRPMPVQLKQLPDDPGGLLRRKMKLEYLRRGQETQQRDQEQRW